MVVYVLMIKYREWEAVGLLSSKLRGTLKSHEQEPRNVEDFTAYF